MSSIGQKIAAILPTVEQVAEVALNIVKVFPVGAEIGGAPAFAGPHLYCVCWETGGRLGEADRGWTSGTVTVWPCPRSIPVACPPPLRAGGRVAGSARPAATACQALGLC